MCDKVIQAAVKSEKKKTAPDTKSRVKVPVYTAHGTVDIFSISTMSGVLYSTV